MYKVPVFLSRPQVEDLANEVQRQISHLEKHLDAQTGTYGEECCESEREWLNSLKGAQHALVLARTAFRMVRSEPDESQPTIIDRAQTKINATMKRTNWGLPGNGGGIA